MRTVVKDANVLIDLATCGLVDAWFAIGIETMTTSFVWNEIESAHQRAMLGPWVSANVLKIVDFEPDELSRVLELHADLRQALSLEDASVLHLSIRENALLLTGDGLLRKCAEQRSIPVAGMLWVLEQIIEHGSISSQAAADGLQTLLDAGSRLPRAICEARIRRWRKT
jgi:predicted nucleic acid-binding protein